MRDKFKTHIDSFSISKTIQNACFNIHSMQDKARSCSLSQVLFHQICHEPFHWVIFAFKQKNNRVWRIEIYLKQLPLITKSRHCQKYKHFYIFITFISHNKTITFAFIYLFWFTVSPPNFQIPHSTLHITSTHMTDVRSFRSSGRLECIHPII